MLGITMYFRLFFVHTMDILFHTYYYCHDSCFYFLNKNTHVRTSSPDIISLTPSPPFFNERYPTPPILFLPPSPFKDTPSPPPFILNIPNIHHINQKNTTEIEKIDKTKKIEKEDSKYSPEIIDINTQNHEFEWDIILDN